MVVGKLYVLGNLVSVSEETHVYSINISDSLGYLDYLVSCGPVKFWFVWTLHQVYVLLGFDSLWAYDSVH